MYLAAGLKIDPDVMLVSFIFFEEFFERDLTVGHEVIGRQRRMENREA